jgi:hypothetical protein
MGELESIFLLTYLALESMCMEGSTVCLTPQRRTQLIYPGRRGRAPLDRTGRKGFVCSRDGNDDQQVACPPHRRFTSRICLPCGQFSNAPSRLESSDTDSIEAVSEVHIVGFFSISLQYKG